jgi:hypothetical protein
MRRILPLVAALLAVYGCGATTAPLPLTPAERVRLDAAQLDLTLGIGEHHAPWAREDFVAALARRRLFRRVDRLESFSEPPDLTATVQVFGNPDNKLPIWTLLTLGVVPTIGKGFDGVSVTLAAPATHRTLDVRIEQQDLIVTGWVGLAMLPSSEWVLAGSYNMRMFDRIASELAARAETIETLPIVLR